MTKRTLHIVDGDSSGGTLRLAGFRQDGDILSWRDALYSGPVPEGLSLLQLSRLRSKFWTDGRRTTEFEKRDAVLVRQAHYNEIVLWFGSSECTLCALSLVQLLSWFRENEVATDRLCRVGIHAGILKPEQLMSAYAKRQSVSSVQMRIANRVWQAFRSASPARLSRLLETDVDILPGMRRAALWLLREYPGTLHGLSRLQRRMLKRIASREPTKISSVVGSILRTEWVGDAFLLDLLNSCAEVEQPLVVLDGPSKARSRRRLKLVSQVVLTDVGHRVLSGKADHILLNGIDRWVGGVHLYGGDTAWRWDEGLSRIVSVRQR